MLQRVHMDGLKLPRLYIAENKQDVVQAKEAGIPYIKWNEGQEALIKCLLRPVLEKMFPHIKWNKVLGKKRNLKSKIVWCSGYTETEDATVAEYDKNAMLTAQLEHDATSKEDAEIRFINEYNYVDAEIETESPIAEESRDFSCNNSELGYDTFFESLPVETYISDSISSVDIEVLMKLGMLPKFLGDIADCIKTNVSNSMLWTEGYTKKLGAVMGNYNRKQQLPNLIILDISASIPDGIAATMVTLIDTLRSQCEADLIITSQRSGYYPAHSELPNTQTIFDYYGRSNEGAEFMAILEQHIAGREFGHVISFGDHDNPASAITWRRGPDGTYGVFDPKMMGTKIHEIHHYHTYERASTGYARWAEECSPEAKITYDTSWCKIMKGAR